MLLKIKYGKKIKIVAFKAPMKLSELLGENIPGYSMPCGSKRNCGKCKIKISGNISEAEPEEKKLLGDEIEKGFRLGCRVVLLGDAETELEEINSENQILIGQIKIPEITENGLFAAVDLGTTTIAAYIFKSVGGKTTLVNSGGTFNRQSIYGADVVSRINASLNGSSDELSRLAKESINSLLLKLIDGNSLKKLIITGNTAMLYLLCGKNPASLAFAPFTADCLFGNNISGKNFGVSAEEVYFPCCISAYAGADLACAVGYAANNYNAGRNSIDLILDIGTNGEAALIKNNDIWCCSAAAGPVFEGAGLTCGMISGDGAIYKVEYNSGNIICSVYGEKKARGLCGSGAVDATAAFLNAGFIDETGFMKNSGEIFFPPEYTVKLTKEDIRELQLGKAAVCAGIYTLLKAAEISPCDVNRVFLAGGFGCSLNPTSAVRIGLIPKEFAGKTIPIGNAAAAGAAELFGKAAQKQLEAIAKSAVTVTLSGNDVFAKYFIECMHF